jgi:DnaJ-class molecular chaperone
MGNGRYLSADPYGRVVKDGDELCLDCEGRGFYPAGHECQACGGTGRVPNGSNGDAILAERPPSGA